ncbi:site-specific integrase [Anaerosalibacter massiliensis]|uniref:site-specific integrase n=1 Tax=Anaerosalibacter massiliensis TaxID=1347392 RepID=UPI0005B2D053|nr:site-specific integrase [Anaerosalibacter massiliensis]
MAGSIEKRGKNKYRLTVSMGSGKNRKRYRRTVECKNKTQASKELAKFVAEIEGNNFIEPSKITFEMFSQKWIEDYAKLNLSPKTVFNYQSMLECNIFPMLGGMKLSEINPIHILGLYKCLKERELSDSYIMIHHILLKQLFESALGWKMINENPLINVKPPKTQKKEASFYNKEEAQQLVKALKHEPVKYQAIILIAMMGGLRKGEVLGLRWEDVDFKNNLIHIKKATQYLPDKGTHEKPTKTPSSIRTIALPQMIIDILKEHEKNEKEKERICAELWKGEGFVFTQKDGSLINPNIPTQWFGRFLERNNLKKITFHELRHTGASLLRDSKKLTIEELSKWLGHSNVSTTMDIYVHPFKKTEEVAADAMEEIFNE